MSESAGTAAPPSVQFAVLGNLRATRAGVALRLGGRQQRAVLALLLLEAGNTVTVERIADALWGDHVPNGATSTIQTYISHLREILEPDRARGTSGTVLVTEPRGYRLAVDSATIDLTSFEQHLRTGRSLAAAAQFHAAAAELRSALALWRGPVLADLDNYDFVQVAARRLDEVRLGALEARLDADLALGRHADVVDELDRLVAAHPLRERLQAGRMLARYRSGRQADALAAYREVHDVLATELGIEPGPTLRQLHARILAQDPTLDLAAPATGPATEPATQPATEPVVAVAAARPQPAAERTASKPTASKPTASEPAESGAPVPRRRRRLRLVLGAIGGIVVLATAATAAGVALTRESALASLPADAVGSVDPNGALRTSAPVGQNPDGVAYGAGSLWIADTDDDTVSRVDPATSRRLGVVRVGDAPTSVAVTGDDVWVVNSGDGTVSDVNARSNTEVGTVQVGNLPVAIAAGPSGVWVTNSGDNTVQRIDPARAVADAPVPVGGSPAGVAVGLDTVWVADSADGTVSRVSPSTGAAQSPVAVGAGPRGLALTGGAVWVTNSLGLTVSRIDMATGVVTTVEVGDGPRSIAAVGGAVWVGAEFDGTLTRIDTTTGRATRRIRTGTSPQGLAAVGPTLWVASRAFASAAHRGGMLTVAVNGLPPLADDPDPVSAYDFPRSALMYDGLVAQRRTTGAAATTLVPDLAVALPSPTDGGHTYTFTVRRGIHYSTGVEVMPGDFRRGVQRTLRQPEAQRQYFLGIVGASACVADVAQCDLSEGIVVDDDARTVTFHLTEPDPEFLYKLTVFAWATAPGVPLGHATVRPPATGPYQVGHVTPGDSGQLTLVRNPAFRQWSFAAQPAGNPDEIRFRGVTSVSAGVAGVLADRADVADVSDDPTLFADLARRYPTQWHSEQRLGSWMEVLNNQIPPFNDLRARQAVNYAVDRRIVAGLLGGSVSCQTLPPNYPGYRPYCPYTAGPTPDGAYHGPDLARARQLVAESGTAGATVVVKSLDATNFKAAAEYYAALLRQLGYVVPAVVVRSYGELFTTDSAPASRTQVFGYWWAIDFASPSNIAVPLIGCAAQALPAPTNPSQTCNPELDAQAAAALAAEAVDPAAARRLWTAYDRAVTDFAPWVMGPALRSSLLVSVRVGNVQVDPVLGEPLYAQMWVH